MSFKELKDVSVKKKKVFLRCDFNIPLNERGNVLEDLRIKKTIPTIDFLIKNDAKVILASHLAEDKKSNSPSLKFLVPILNSLLGVDVTFVNDCKGPKVKKAIEEMNYGDVLLLENLRKYKEEKENDQEFAKELAELAEVYINEAFSVCHREHASIIGIPKFIEHAAGFLLEEEVRVLSKIRTNPWRPLVIIIGGAKVASKIKSIGSFLEFADHLLLGGKLLNDILIIKGISSFKTWPAEEIVTEAKKIDLTSPKIHFPIDVMASPTAKGDYYVRKTAPGLLRKDEDIYDIGPETIAMYSEIIKSAKMIVWGGPLGFFEEKKFEKGTKEIAYAISRNHKAFRVIGGGDTIRAFRKFGFSGFVDYLSMGGGAMLEFLTKGDLPGIKALK